MSSSKLKYVIVEPAFLFVRGLIFTLQQIMQGEIIVFSNDLDLGKNISEEAPDILLVNEKIYQKNREKIFRLKDTLYFKILVLSPQKPTESMETLYYRDDKETVYKKISALVSTLEKEENANVLSKREKDIVRNIALGLSNKEIAHQLSISIHTVMTHRKNIVRKLRINSPSGLTIYAIIHQLIDIKEFT